MPDKFNMQSPPFDRLTKPQQRALRSSLDVAYFRRKETIVDAQKETSYLHVLIKGSVEEISLDGQEVFAHYADDDIFDVRSQFDQKSRHNYIALEDTLVYLLPNEKFLELYYANGEFAAYFDNNLAKRQQLIEAAQQQQNLAEFILTKVDNTIYHPPLILDPELTLVEVTQELKKHGVDAALIKLHPEDTRLKPASTAVDKNHRQDPPTNTNATYQQPAYGHCHPYGIVTRTNMLHALALDKCSLESKIGTIATFPVCHVDEGDFLFNAMITMTKQKMKRLMVCDGNQAVGMLDMTQILSVFSTHSHVLSLSIARASSVEELTLAANKQRNLVDSLITNGIRTRFIMQLISAVNEQIIEKAFELVVPPALHQHLCLLVLGSEGRGEQILKTDQDNALITEDNVSYPELPQLLDQLTHTLQQLGYPLCPGKVMVNNTEWVKTASEWQQTLSHWIKSATPEQIMKVAIFSDAHCVAGNRDLLPPIKQHLLTLVESQQWFLSQFTRPALSFSSPLTLFGQVKTDKQGVDIKQGGIFPIVHGVRALCLEHAISDNNTFNRIEALEQKRVLEKQTAQNLSEALKLFIKVRLAQQLALNHSHNRVELKLLDRTERDLLRHSLHVVKKFKQWLGYHYQIRE